MATLLSIVFLIAGGAVMAFIDVFILNVAGLLGALIGGKPQKRLWTARYFFGFVIATICQSYVYLAYTAFVVNWTQLVISNQGVSFIIIWPVAFLAVMAPIFQTATGAIKEATEDKYFTNVQIDAISWTVFITLVGFFLFIFAPNIMHTLYSWVPYVGPR